MRSTLLAGLVVAVLARSSATPIALGAPSDDLTFECSPDGMEVAHLLDVAQEVTGEAFFFDPRDVRDQRIFFQGTVVVPRAAFLSFFDTCLRDAEFVHLDSWVAGTRVHSIRRLGQQSRGQQALKSQARIVPPEEMAALADRFTLITSWVVCNSGASARQIACPTLCQFFTDSSIESIRSIEGTGVILMTGLSANVAKYSAMARQLDTAFSPDVDAGRTNELEERICVLEERVTAMLKARAETTDR
jgi:hypothetical protein